MSFLDKLIQSVLPSGQEVERGDTVLVKRTIKRSEKYKYDFEEWKTQQSYNFSIRALKEEWETRSEIAAVEAIFFYYNSPKSNGFVYYFDNGTSNEEASFLFELLKYRVKQLDYSINHSEEEVKEQKDFVLTKESYYLKPKLKYRKSVPFQQLYGTIRIEFTSRDGRPYYLKLMANYFSDRSYQDPHSFEELAEHLFVF
jgi:hypothetical protein